MIDLDDRRADLVRKTIGALTAVYGATFIVAVVLHLGVRVPLGSVSGFPWASLFSTSLEDPWPFLVEGVGS